MSYPQKRTLVTIFAFALIYAAYWIYTSSRMLLSDPLRSWAIIMLIFGGITVAAMIVVQVLFHVLLSVGAAVKEAVKEAVNDPENIDEAKIGQSVESQFIEDERDKMLALKSKQVSYGISGFGFLAGLVSLVLNAPPVVMLNIVFGAGFLSTVVEGLVTLIFYRKGFSNA